MIGTAGKRRLLQTNRRKFDKMRKPFSHHEHHGEERCRIPVIGWILMGIGLLTVLYFLITYALMPLLAMLTVS